MAGQSSPGKSFYTKKETFLSNFTGCSNFLKVLKKYNLSSKFINFSSCEIYGDYKKKISIETGSGNFFKSARELFKKFGFEPCEPFAHYTEDPNSCYYTKNID